MSKYSIWHKWTDGAEQEMLILLGVITKRGITHVPDTKDY
jgi:hypothetical protein